MSEYYNKRLCGKYQVIMEFPQSLRELLWRVAYFRRNQRTWDVLIKSFKPSTTHYDLDETIKNNTKKVLEELLAFYESASTLDPILWKSTVGPKFFLQKPSYWPAANVALNSNSANKHPVYDTNLRIESGLQTPLDASAIKNGVSTTKKNALRMQAGNPFDFTSDETKNGVPAAENLTQDIQMMIESAKMILTSYGSPYTTERGEECSRWLFNSRNTAMKAIALIVQECPWIIQAINSFNFFTADIINNIGSLKPAGDYTQIYGHFESSDDSKVDSPRHLLTPLWSTKANINSSQLSSLETQGTFQIRYFNSEGNPGEPQDLLSIYCNDTYEANSFATNKTY